MKLSIREKILYTLKKIKLNDINQFTQGDYQQRFLTDIDEMTNIFFKIF